MKILVFLSLAACSYQSQYVPPMDGRARPVWHKNTVLAHLARDPGVECGRAVIAQIAGKAIDLREVPGWRQNSRVVVGPAVGFVMFWPWLLAPIPFPVPLIYPSERFFWNSISWLLFAAIVVLPFVDIGVAADRPEDERTSVAAIDAVNAYNDLSRAGDNPCAY